uniref:Homologous-pairing protein 2 homolog n=1 Tax=Prasiolopsis wulf-kochii TaxID=3239232 RepID=A0A0K0MXX0_9CHLO|nr:homologous pairing protein 2 [Prasiolopsis sp. SAG 84.81]
MAEDMCRGLLLRENKPFNTQGITDCLAQFGVKKGQAQKALDNLVAAADGIVCKEFGKTKLYFASQASVTCVSPEVMETKKQLNASLSQQNTDRAATIKRVGAELNALKGSLSLKQVEERIETLKQEVAENENKLKSVQTGSNVVSKAERQKVEQVFTANMGHWRKRRRVFQELWDAVSESISRRRADLFEEIGIEADDVELLKKQQQLERNTPKRRCM